MSISRRRFLEDSMFAIAAAGAAQMAVSAKPLFAQDAQEAKAADQLGVFIVGCGGRSGDHVGAFLADPRTRIAAVCDPDEKAMQKRADAIAEKQGFKPKLYRDMREGFADKSVDVVACSTTNHWHTLCAIWAMQAGKHCYIEKPISHNVHEGKAIAAAAKKYGLICQTGTQCRSMKSNIDSVEFIRSGRIGDVNFSRGLCYKRRKSIGALGDYPISKDVDYDLWSGPAQIKPLTRKNLHYDWHWQRYYGNGDFGNQGPHQTDIARWHLGMDRYPNSVITYGGRLGYQAEQKNDNYIDAGDVANTEVAIFDYGDKCLVFETRGLETPALNGPAGNGAASVGVISYGTDGYLVQSQYNYSAAFDKTGKLIQEFKGGGDHYKNFIEAVLKNDSKVLAADARCGALSAGLSHIGNISYYLGEKNFVSVDSLKKSLADVKSLDDNAETLDRTVQHLEKNGVDLKKYPISLGPTLIFDPKKEEFIGNSEANAMLTRDYRSGFVVPTPDKV